MTSNRVKFRQKGMENQEGAEKMEMEVKAMEIIDKGNELDEAKRNFQLDNEFNYRNVSQNWAAKQAS